LKNGAIGVGYLSYKADSLKVKNRIYQYSSESYYVTGGYSSEFIRYLLKIGYGIETQNHDKFGGILLDNSCVIELPVWIFKFGFELGFGGIINLKETNFSDANYYYGIVFCLRTSSEE